MASTTDPLFDLVAALGDFIGSFPLHERNSVLNVAEVELRHYVSEIPPLSTDAYTRSLD